jgi:phosphatidate cytidylyltransferase
MITGFGIMLLCAGIPYHVNGYSVSGNLTLPMAIAGFLLLVMGVILSRKTNVKALGAAFAGLGYISLSWGLLLWLKDITVGNQLAHTEQPPLSILIPLVIIGCMWVNDTMAYIIGSLIGRTPLSPISPKKTWEGTIGGIITASLLMAWLALELDGGMLLNRSFTWWLGLCVIATVAGTFGDLLESKLKRLAGVKDSGTLMPGHGGFLDRFDSLLLATPFVTIYVLITIR